MSGRAIAAWNVAIIATAVVAAIDAPMSLRLLGAFVFVVLVASVAWVLLANLGKHAVYYLRDRDGAVIYVGVTSPRGDADDACVYERMTEHFDGAGEQPWKATVVPSNCSVARWCITRRGALASERRRIKTFVAAGPRRKHDGREIGWNVKDVLIHNVAHADKPGVPVLSLAWYLLESTLSEGARWHRPLIGKVDDPPAPPRLAEVERRAVVHVPQRDGDGIADFQADAAAAVRRRAQAQHPAGDGGVSADVGDDDQAAIDAEFRRLVGPLLVEGRIGSEASPQSVGDVGGDGAAGDHPPTGCDLPGGDVTAAVTTGEAVTPERPDDEPRQQEGCPQPDENSATNAPGADVDTDAADDASEGASEAPAVGGDTVKPCVVTGCVEPVARRGRCIDHARQYDKERQDRKRRKEGN